MHRFATISNFFTVDGGGLYLGQAIVSEYAIYLAAGLAPFTLASLFTGGIGKKVSPNSGPLTLHLSELPKDVVDHPDWPVKTTDGFVYVFYAWIARKRTLFSFGNAPVVEFRTFGCNSLGYYPAPFNGKHASSIRVAGLSTPIWFKYFRSPTRVDDSRLVTGHGAYWTVGYNTVVRQSA